MENLVKPDKEKPIRVILAKFELESHDRGARLIAKMFVEAGMEVIYIVFRNIEEVIRAAIEEDADVIGLSTLSGDTHKVFTADLMKGLAEKSLLDSVLVIVGGRIPDADVPFFNSLGVKGIFGPGSLRDEIVDYIKQNVKQTLTVS